jgi:sulfate adenylyltransferase subunit 2
MNPFDYPADQYTYLMKTQPLLAALEKHRFDAAIGGARRDEEKSRAKERVFSFRNTSHRWDPKDQRPEPWRLYNARKAPGETFRVFPLSNWTELDIWEYIGREEIPVVPLYFSKPRPVVERNGILIAADDARMKLGASEKIRDKAVRFRTLGCYPLTAAVESDASSVAEIVNELRKS